jgi:Fis family transcriptional regulator
MDSFSPPVKSLGSAVADSLDDYFRRLNGQAPTDFYDTFVAQVEPPLLRATLKYCNCNQTRAAELLGFTRATLRKKLCQHRIKATDLK